MIEKQIERYLVHQIGLLNGLCFKFVSPSNAGVPDRLCLIYGYAFFVETKAPGEKPRELQKAVAKQIRKRGTKVYCMSSKEQVDDLIRSLSAGMLPQESRYDRI